jgi:CheY-like chemotaxis protein
VRAAKRILVIEDDPDVRSAVADALREAGLLVDVAKDGFEGIEQLTTPSPPAVILLDLRMPRMGGEELLRRVRSDPRLEEIPVITMTGGPDLGVKGSELLAHLRKPFDLDDLLQVVLSLTDASAAA